MRVAWVQDLNIWTIGGGAQETDREIVKYGMKKGHEIELVTPENFALINQSKFDFVVFSNIHTLMYTNYAGIAQVAAKYPYVVYHHDFPCRYRIYFPMQARCVRCVFLPPWKELYANSRLNLFMSPLHKDAFLSIMPEIQNRPFDYVPSAINPEDYKCPVKVDPKPNTVIGVSSLYGFKGRDNVVKYAEEHRELHFTFISGTDGDVLLPPNCEYLGNVPHDVMVLKYAENEYFIHLPAHVQACERTVAEYAIANPKGRFIVNNLIGILSFPGVIDGQRISKEKLIELVSTSPEKFWEAVKHRV